MSGKSAESVSGRTVRTDDGLFFYSELPTFDVPMSEILKHGNFSRAERCLISIVCRVFSFWGCFWFRGFALN